MAILVRNKKCMSVPFDTATFLRVFPRGMCCSSVQQSLGSYTSARTVGRRAIFGFDAHVDRLGGRAVRDREPAAVGSAVSMIEADSDTNKARVDIADVKERLTEDLAAALEYSKFEGELFITSLVSWTTPDFSTPASVGKPPRLRNAAGRESISTPSFDQFRIIRSPSWSDRLSLSNVAGRWMQCSHSEAPWQ
eukprot:Polyplicarium_translucidae@DN2106_c0_g1_i6.p2